MISVLLVDDEPFAHEAMRALLGQWPGVEVMATAGSVAEARACLENHQPQVVFLDVEMPGGDAFSLLPEVSDATLVVFVTAHEKHAVDAFAVGAVDYLVKPVDPERLAVTLARLESRLGIVSDEPNESGDAGEDLAEEDPTGETSGRGSLSVPLRKTRFRAVVRIEDICWIESLRNYTRVGLRNPARVLVFRRRLGEWLPDLPQVAFVRISRSEVVQLGLVAGTEWQERGTTIVTFDGDSPPFCIGRMAAIRLGRLLTGGGVE